MEIFSGKSVFGGIAVGKISVFSKKEHRIARVKVVDTDAETSRFEKAKMVALEQLKALYEKACREVGEANAAIFEVHQMMLEDDDFTDSVNNIITVQQVNAEYAVGVTADNFANMFSAMEDEYMRGRAADVKDISERLIMILKGGKDSGIATDEPVIVLADDLAP